jgi:nicotinamide-nucleotide amidase
MSDFQDVVERVLRHAAEGGLTLATAESCTAGCLATLLADAPGAGEQFHGGFVVYSKEQKAAVLGVEADLIASHTAVSEPVAKAMAAGVLASCPADIGIAITGVAGPDPDEDGNPVGILHVAVACRGGGIHHRRLQLGEETRGALRVRAMKEALDLVEKVLGAFADRKPAHRHPS